MPERRRSRWARTRQLILERSRPSAARCAGSAACSTGARALHHRPANTSGRSGFFLQLLCRRPRVPRESGRELVPQGYDVIANERCQWLLERTGHQGRAALPRAVVFNITKYAEPLAAESRAARLVASHSCPAAQLDRPQRRGTVVVETPAAPKSRCHDAPRHRVRRDRSRARARTTRSWISSPRTSNAPG